MEQAIKASKGVYLSPEHADLAEEAKQSEELPDESEKKFTQIAVDRE